MSVFEGLSLPKILYVTESTYNGRIEVVEVGKTRKIIVDKTTQSVNWDSPSVPRKVWGRIVDVLYENEPNLNNILIFGLGGGTMQHVISKRFPGIHMVSVEIDRVMVDIANKYFDLEKIPNHKVIIEDACRVLLEPDRYGVSSGSFQAAIVDIYCGEKFPELGKSGNFLAELKRLLVPGGLVIFNRIYLEHHQDDVDDFIDILHNFFYDVKAIIIAGVTNTDNVLIFGRT